MRTRLLAGGVILLLLVLLAEVYLAAGGLSPRVRQMVSEQSAALFSEPVTVSEVYLSILPPRAVLRGVILPAAEPWLQGGTVEAVKVRLSPWSLLTGGVRSLDITLLKPKLRLSPPKAADGQGDGAPLQIPWGAWTTYRMRVVDGRIALDYGDRAVALEGLSFTAQPDVTLRSFRIELSNRAITWDGAPLLDSVSLDVTLRADRIRLRSARFVGPVGSLSLSGEVRTEKGAPVVGLKTVYDGELADAMDLIRRFGGAPPSLAGGAHLSGRLYGPPGDLHWNGEISARHVTLTGQPREMARINARLRVTLDRIELVHAKVAAGGGELRATGVLTLGDEPAYKTRLRADDVALSWLLGSAESDTGSVSGEAHLKGPMWGHPQGTVAWRYRNPHSLDDHPDGVDAALWKRLAVKLVSGRGDTVLTADGGQRHQLDLNTRISHIGGRIGVTVDGALDGELTAHADDFAELGLLIGLAYVHGNADVGARLGGSLKRFELTGTGTLADGRIRDLGVSRLTGRFTLRPGRLTFRDVHTQGDGRIAMAGSLDFPPREKRDQGPTVHLAANLKQVPLTPLAGLFYLGGPLELDVPVSGRVNLVRRPGQLKAWGNVTAASGTLYGQPIHGAQMGMWITQDHMVLNPVRFDVMDDGRVASAEGEGSLRWQGGSYQVHLNTVRLPMSAIKVLHQDLPFLVGTFAGGATLVGDFDDPLLRAEGRLRDVSFYGNPVGRGRFSMALSHWQLRLTADLSGPGVGDANPPGRMVYYNRLVDDGPFAVSVRLTDADMVPWLRGLLPEVDALVREQLGDDYDLSASGRVSASGTIAAGPEIMQMGFTDATLGAGGLAARLLGRAELSYRDGTLVIPDLAMEGSGLTLTVAGEMVPEQRFDLKVAGIASAPWLHRVRPEYGVIGGDSGFNLNVTGDWDVPWLSGTVSPEALAVAPPEMADIDGIITVSGDVAISGLLESPQEGTVRANFSNLSLTAFGNTVSASGVPLLGVDGVYTLPGVELTGPVGRLRVSGGWDVDKTVALEAVGTLHLSEMSPQVPGLSDGSGEVRVSGELTGPWDDPEVNGGADLSAARLYVDSLEQVLRIDSASILLNGSRMVLDHLEGRIGGGPVVARGAYDTTLDHMELMLSLEQYSYRPLEGLRATVSGDFALIGTLPAPTLSGDLYIHKALFDRRMQWGAWVVDMIAASQQEIAQVVSFGDTRLSLRVSGDRDIVVDNNLAKLVLELDLLATGTLSEPGLVGRMRTRTGEVEYRDQVFTLDYANLDFVSPDRIAPYVDILAHTTVQRTLPNDPLGTEPVDVSLSLNGPIDQVDLTLSSQPDLPQNDLLSLLAVGRTADDLSGSGVGAGEATYLVTGKLQNRLEEQIHRFTGLDRFQVDPFYAEDATETNSARVTVGKKLFDGRGRVTYSTVVDATKEPLINFSYRIGPRVSLLLQQDQEGRKGGEVRYRIRFR